MRKYAKAIVAIIGATITAAATIYNVEWLPVLAAFTTAVGVFMVPNFPE